MDIMAEQKKEMTETEKNNLWLKEKLENFAVMFCTMPGIIGAGYMFFTGESVGWIVAGFFGGFAIPVIIGGIIAAPFIPDNPLRSAEQQRQLEHYTWMTTKL